MQDSIKAILIDILDADDFEWDDTLTPADFDSWDSMNNLRIITALEDEFDLTLPMEAIEKMQTLGQIAQAIADNQS